MYKNALRKDGAGGKPTKFGDELSEMSVTLSVLNHPIIELLRLVRCFTTHFLNRCKRLGFCDNSIPTISDIFSNADDSLFKAILKNSYHVLYPYLPENQYQHYHILGNPHNKALIPKTTYLSDRDYIMRMLYTRNVISLLSHVAAVLYVITQCVCVCYFRDVYPFNCLIIAMYVYHLGLYCILFRKF